MCNWLCQIFGGKCNCQKEKETEKTAAPVAANVEAKPTTSQPENVEKF